MTRNFSDCLGGLVVLVMLAGLILYSAFGDGEKWRESPYGSHTITVRRADGSVVKYQAMFPRTTWGGSVVFRRMPGYVSAEINGGEITIEANR